MKERPILFSSPMVRAILSGAKSQTRRVVKPQFANDAIPVEFPATDPAGGWVVSGHSGAWWCEAAANPDDLRRCPYGQPGDRLWVRETHAFTDLADGTPVVTYAADNRQIAIGRSAPDDDDYLIHSYQFADDVHLDRWRPSIHMPRWASRITLEVTGVRVERLRDISNADAMAEGVRVHPDHHHRPDTSRYSPVSAYRDLWESINGPDSWEANPWVWVVEIKKLEGDAA